MSSVKMIIASFFLALLWAGNVWAYTINDSTLVGRGTTSGTESSFYWTDHIDNSSTYTGNFNVFGINISKSSSTLNISLFTNFDGSDSAGGVPIHLADLGLDLNRDGTYEYGVAFTYTGESITGAQLYKNAAWNTAKFYLEGKTSGNFYYGEAWGDATHNSSHNGQSPIVHIAGGDSLGSVGYASNYYPGQYPTYSYDLSISLALFGTDLGSAWGIFWGGATCANDIIEAQVPIPASLLLLSSGLVGMLGISKRRRAVAA